MLESTEPNYTGPVRDASAEIAQAAAAIGRMANAATALVTRIDGWAAAAQSLLSGTLEEPEILKLIPRFR